MKSRLSVVLAATALLSATVPALAQTPPAADWRQVAPENLLVIDTSKGRVVVELDPLVAPNHVERIRTLANAGFYDGLKFHRVITGFMAQTGDPQGTGQGGSDLPDIAGEFTFRRGRDAGFAPVANSGAGLRGLVGSIPVVTQPDAQMFVTSDFKVGAQPLFCPGVMGMARSSSPDSANSQFFLMTGANASLDGKYTVLGRVLSGLDVVKALKAGPEGSDGAVGENPDTMTTVRLASSLPQSQRPTARVMDVRSPAFAQLAATTQGARGAAFSICDIQPTAEVTGG